MDILQSNNNFENNTSWQNICPKKALFMLRGTSGKLEPVISEEKCTNCGLCAEFLSKLKTVNKRNEEI